jgi:hypothetical protein
MNDGSAAPTTNLDEGICLSVDRRKRSVRQSDVACAQLRQLRVIMRKRELQEIPWETVQ